MHKYIHSLIRSNHVWKNNHNVGTNMRRTQYAPHKNDKNIRIIKQHATVEIW